MPRTVVAKMLRIGRCKKRALVMIKPPGHAWRARILEIHNCIFIAIECAVGKRLRGTVRHARQPEVGVCMEAFAVETRKHGGRSRAVKAPVMEAQPYTYRVRHAQSSPLFWPKRKH
jgi:hypothetical protein